MLHARVLEWQTVNCLFFQIYAALNIFFGMVSIGLLTVVAIDRYLTICCPDVGNDVFLVLLNEIIHCVTVTQHVFILKYRHNGL